MFPAAELGNYIEASWSPALDKSALLLYISGRDYISLSCDAAEAVINGEAVSVAAGAKKMEGEYYLPLDLLENVGYTVAWDKESRRITVAAKGEPEPEDPVTEGWPTLADEMDVPGLPEGMDVIKGWYFDTDPEGWEYGGNSALTWKNGVIYLYDTAANDPIAYSPTGLNIDISKVTCIRVRVRTDTPSGKLKLYFTTAAGEAMSSSKVFKAAYDAAVPGADGYYTFDIDCSGADAWTGVLERLRVTPASTTGKFYIDSVELLGVKE